MARTDPAELLDGILFTLNKLRQVDPASLVGNVTELQDIEERLDSIFEFAEVPDQT